MAQIPSWLEEHFGQFGAALAIIEGDSSQVFYHGLQDVEAKIPVTAKTVFEIGSVSKTMVGLLFADAVLRQEVDLAAPLRQYLPQLQQHSYSLLDLATHHSGLPRLPHNMALVDLSNPYRDYDWPRLIEGLQTTTPASSPDFEYSNLGYGLLAEVLAQQANLSFAQLMQQRVLSPLGMTQAAVALPQHSIVHLAKAHQLDGTAVQNWQFQALAGAGAVVATLADMQSYVQAYLKALQTKSDPRFALSLQPQRNLSPSMAIGMGWMIQDADLYWHNGQTAGFSSFVGFDVKRQRAVILLANVAIDVTQPAQLLLKAQ